MIVNYENDQGVCAYAVHSTESRNVQGPKLGNHLSSGCYWWFSVSFYCLLRGEGEL